METGAQGTVEKEDPRTGPHRFANGNLLVGPTTSADAREPVTRKRKRRGEGADCSGLSVYVYVLLYTNIYTYTYIYIYIYIYTFVYTLMNISNVQDLDELNILTRATSCL